MNRKKIITFAVGALAGLAVAWLLGFWDGKPESATASVATQTAPVPASPANGTPKPSAPLVVYHPTAPAVALPSLPPAQPHQPTANEASAPPITFLNPEQRKAVTNNLRQLATAASQYMLDKGVTQAGYFDLVGTNTDNYIRSVSPVSGEDYQSIMVHQMDTQVEIVTPGGESVDFNL